MRKKKINFVDLCMMIRDERQPEEVTHDGVVYHWDGSDYYSQDAGCYLTGMDDLAYLSCNACIEYGDPVLDDIERKYLRGVILPFIDEVDVIVKEEFNNKEAIYVHTPGSVMKFPSFPKGKMYKGMRKGQYYNPKALGLEK